MPINGATILEGATCSATGGTAKTFSQNGANIKNGVQVVDTSVIDSRLRPAFTATSRVAAQQPDGKWSFERRDLTLVRPKLLADGSVAFNSVRVIFAFHPESSAAEIAELKGSACQPLFDADFANYFLIGSLA